MSPWFLVVALFLLVANGVFVAKEFSLIASRRTKLEGLAEDGNVAAKWALEAAGEIPLQLASSQLGVTMASLGLGAVAEPTVAGGLEHLFGLGGWLPHALADALGLVIGLGIVVFFHMVFGEMVPKYVALADPEKVLLKLAVPNRAYVALFRPIIRALNAVGNAATRVFGVEPRDELETTHTAEEIASMLAVSRDKGLIEDIAHDLLTGALDFGERRVRDVMVPRDAMSWVPRTATVEDAERLVVASGHSRLIVAGRDLDEVVGFIHAKDLLTVPATARDRPLPLARIRRVLVLPESRPLDEVLVAMRRSRTHLGVVVDDDRHVTGLATLEDVLEDLVGDIVDESDPGSTRVRPRITPRRRTRP
jgi:CBS domain containing-hemolysin-like protein